MTKTEAAQKWAEAKDALDAALAARTQAEAAHESADRAEREAWDALEALAGRTPERGEAMVVTPTPPDPPLGNSLGEVLDRPATYKGISRPARGIGQ